MDLTNNLRQRCHINTNDDGDNFVGVKADSDNAIIYFPIGYNLPQNDAELRSDINNLFSVLSTFMKRDKIVESSKFEAPRTVDFPIHAYLTIIRIFLNNSGEYYIESDPEYKTAATGKTSWPKTLRNQRALVQRNGTIVFTNFTVRITTPNINKEITQIHRYCVYEAFEKLGWLYVPFMPEKPSYYPNNKASIQILNKKLASTNNDKEQQLFSAMKSMLEYLDKDTKEMQFYFGTDYFESIWEKMIDKAFGIENKEEFFPKTRWILDFGDGIGKKPLIPDTIMIFNNKYYVIDSKFYRYGRTCDSNHLPNGTDINKQITYAEYIEKAKSINAENIYNCFLMPFNQEKNGFSTTENIKNIGEAIGEWRYKKSDRKSVV